MNMQKIKEMSNEELLELYSAKVRCDHYDPMGTPKNMKELENAGISQDDLFSEVLSRMEPR